MDERKNRLLNIEATLVGKDVVIAQGDGGESTTFLQGKVTKYLPPSLRLPYGEIEIDGNGKFIPIQNGITTVTILSAREN